MSLRAKMRVGTVKKSYSSNWQTKEPVESMELVMYPVVGDTGANKSWNKSTPSGELKLVVNNPNAFAFIESMPGKEFYIDITEAGEDTLE